MSDMFTFRDTLTQTGDTASGGNLEGYELEASDGSIGKVLASTHEASESYLIVDTGGWLLSKKVMLPAGVVERVDHDGRAVFVNRTRDEIKDAPEFDESRLQESEYRETLSRHYG